MLYRSYHWHQLSMTSGDARHRRASMASGGGALLESLAGTAAKRTGGLYQGVGAAFGSQRQMLRRQQEEDHHRPLEDDEVFGEADGGGRLEASWSLIQL